MGGLPPSLRRKGMARALTPLPLRAVPPTTMRRNVCGPAGYGANVALADTLDEALAAVFESDPIPTPEPTPGPNPDPNPTPTPTPTPTPGPSGDPLTDLQSALADAQAAYERGQAALADGDFAGYGEAQADLEAALRRAQEAEARLTGDDGGQPA